jgi:hypothetical protein
MIEGERIGLHPPSASARLVVALRHNAGWGGSSTAISKQKVVRDAVHLDFLRKAMEWVVDASIFQDMRTHGNTNWIAKELASQTRQPINRPAASNWGAMKRLEGDASDRKSLHPAWRDFAGDSTRNPTRWCTGSVK